MVAADDRGLKQVRQRVVEALHQIVRAVRLDFKACVARKDVVDAASARIVRRVCERDARSVDAAAVRRPLE